MRLAILFAISLFIVACAQQQAPAESPADAEQQPVVEAEPETEPAPAEPVVESRDVATVFDGLPDDVQDILKNGEKNAETKGFSYTIDILEGKYQSTHPIQGAEVHQKGGLAKIVLVEPEQRVDPAVHVDTVYLNLEEQTATGACNDRVLCKDNEGPREVAYADYSFMTPISWIEQMEDPVKMEEKTVQSRKAIRLDADVGGTPTSIWVDRYSGLPIMVEQGDTVYEYVSFALGVKDSDVTP